MLSKFIPLAAVFELTSIGAFLSFFLPFYDIFGGFAGVLVIFLLPNFLWPLWDSNSQTLHDKIVGTYVVRA